MEDRRIDIPQVFFARIPLVRGGWKVPARTETRDGLWRAVVDEVEGAWTADPLADRLFVRVHTARDLIPEWQYFDLIDLKRWARAYQPDHPCLHPDRPMHPMTTPVVRLADIRNP